MARSEKRGSEARLEKRAFKVEKRGKVKKRDARFKKEGPYMIYIYMIYVDLC